MNEILTKEKNKFINRVENTSMVEKKYLHYNSVLNLSDAIMFYKNNEADELKKLLIHYFFELEEIDYNPSHLERANLYSKYLLPVGKFLIQKKEFITKMNFYAKIVYGVILDIGVYYFLGYISPIFIITFLIWGYVNQRNAIKEKRFFQLIGNFF